ncbi:MAG: hypothetical protein LBQ95_03090, partial [Lachnospiraceae bacterium]|nr:hypothetical protein [Lachnospiraceae bacterium]
MNQKNRKRKRKKKTSLSKIFLVVGIVLIIIIAGVFLLVKFNGKAQEEKSAGEQTEDGQTNEDVIAVGADLSLDDSGANPVNQLPPEPEIPEDHRGKAEPIPEEVRAMMAGISMPEGASVSYDDLSYLTVYYHDFEGEDAIGNIVVDADLAEEVLDIFKDLYDIDYPIQSVRLIDEFNDLQTDEFN